MLNSSNSATDVYSVLDEWWGEEFGPSVADRIDLPYDQALSLYDHCSQRNVPLLPTDEPSTVRLRPVLTPWIVESQDAIFATAHARTMLDMLSGTSNAVMYEHFRYAGAYKRVLGDDSLHPVGSYKLWCKVDPWLLMQKKLMEIHSLALYSHKVLLNIHSIVPKPPEVPKDSARYAWVSDIRHRLAFLILTRPLHETGAITFGTDGSIDSSMQLSDFPAEKLLLSRSEQDQFLESMELLIHGEAPSESMFRYFISQTLSMTQLQDSLRGTAVAETQLYCGKPALERIVGDLLSQATGRPVDALMKKWMQLPLPVPDGSDIPAVIWATTELRRDSQLYSEWRMALEEALQYATTLAGDNSASTEFLHLFENKLGPKIKGLREEISRVQQFRNGVENSTVSLGIGSMTLFGVQAVGGNVVEAAAGAAATTIGTAAWEFIKAYRAPKNPNAAMSTYLSLGLK